MSIHYLSSDVGRPYAITIPTETPDPPEQEQFEFLDSSQFDFLDATDFEFLEA